MGDPTVLITGATGFLGGCTLARLLETRPDCRILLLIRDRGRESIEVRLRRSIERFLSPDAVAAGLSRCQIIPGDLIRPGALDSPLLNEVTHVLHFASNTNLLAGPSVRHANILGTMSLAHRMRRVAGLQRFVHVSTAYICGERATPVVHEEDFPRLRSRHFTEYTASKSECELLLRATAPDLPLVIARPSIVVGHSQLGCKPSSSIFWFYRACDLLRRISCPLDSWDDVVPVDWVAEALLLLLFKPELRHDCYHVSAGLESRSRWRDIAAGLAACDGGKTEYSCQQIASSMILKDRDFVAQRLGSDGVSHLLRALEVFYRFMEIPGETFDNSRLLAEGMPPGPRFTDYLPRCVESLPNGTVYEQMLADFGELSPADSR
jgi:nucleoside-diphosphate-sugar epimerase